MGVKGSYYGGIVLENLVFQIDVAKQESYSKRGLRYMQNGNNNLLIDFADTSKSPSTENATGSIVNGATFSNFAPYHLATHTTTYWHDTTRPEWKSSAGIGTFYGNIEFDGINDYVMFGNTPEMTGITDITVSAWFYVNKFKSGVSMITSRYNNISTNNGWELYYDNQGVVYFGGRESNAAYIYVTSSMTVDSGSFDYSGNIDSSFVYGTGFNLTERTMTVQSDGKILVGGDFTTYKGTTAKNIIRLNADGSKDNSFVFGTGFNGRVLGISVQSDGKILVVGGFTTYNSTSASRIIRLNANGSVDSTFVSGSGFTNDANCVEIQSDGKILVGGPFTTYNGISANGIIRLNSDGTKDTSFVYGTGFTKIGSSAGLISIKVQSDGKILCVGYASTYNVTTSINNIIRLNSDGSVDTSFVYGTGFVKNIVSPYICRINCVEVQANGKILVGGDFTTYNGTTAKNIIRLNSDGSVDTSFVYGTGVFNAVSGGVFSIAIQGDGKIILCGIFTNYNGTDVNHIIRLNSDGSVDAPFISSTGGFGTASNTAVFTVRIGIGGGILAAGSFLTYNGTSARCIVSLISSTNCRNGGWYNAVGTKRGNNWSIYLAETNKYVVDSDISYVDSTIPVLKGSINAGTGTASFQANNLYIGMDPTSSLNMDGRLMSLSIYNKALSVSEINQNYKSMSNRILKILIPCPDCIAHDVTIGTQIWTGCNATVSTYRDGTIIPQVTNLTTWNALTTGAWCYYDNDPANEVKYGKLYNWYAVNDPRGLAPSGYHVPSNTEWITLSDYLGGLTAAGGKMKEAGLCHWNTPNTGATNISGFTGLASGGRTYGAYANIGNYGFWWSSTSIVLSYAGAYFLENTSGDFKVGTGGKIDGFSVRFIKDVITEFITLWKTDNAGTSGSNQITIPINVSNSYNYSVDWGDSTTSTGVTTAITHTYATAGTYTVKINGTYPSIYFANSGDRLKLLEVKNWGSNIWTNMVSAFMGCENLRITATDAPNLSTVTDMHYMFWNCILMDDPIGHWDTSNVTDMGQLFMGATNFNQDISGWNTGNVANMAYMFAQAPNFNQPIGTWNTANVTDMHDMFLGATNFNQPIGTWNTIKVVNMKTMFAYSKFNQPIGTWNTIAVTNMSYMFMNTPDFNQPIGTWNTIAVTNMNNMFSYSGAFNQPIGTWNTANVTDMHDMFLYSPVFDKDISGWNVSNVTNMSQMFRGATSFNCGGGGAPTAPHQVPNPYESETNVLLWKTSALTNTSWMFAEATSFNIPLLLYMDLVTNMSYMFIGATSFNQNLEENYGYWVTSSVLDMNGVFWGATSFNNGGIAWMAWQTNNVTNMSSMFGGATLFNADITSWTTNNVTNMSSMFSGAAAFNQNIGVWNISNVTNFGGFMATKTPLTLSTTNLNGIYNGWASVSVKPNINISFGSAKRTAASTAARLVLTSAPNNWSIADGGI